MSKFKQEEQVVYNDCVGWKLSPSYDSVPIVGFREPPKRIAEQDSKAYVSGTKWTDALTQLINKYDIKFVVCTSEECLLPYNNIAEKRFQHLKGLYEKKI